MDITELFLNGLPDWVELLPKDWEGERETVEISACVSKTAINNKRFDLEKFILKQFYKAIEVTRKRKGLDVFRLYQFRITMDPYWFHKGRIMFFVNLEYEPRQELSKAIECKGVEDTSRVVSAATSTVRTVRRKRTGGERGRRSPQNSR